MLFDTFEFWLFYLIVVGFFYLLPFCWGRIFLIGSSLFFYGWWDYRFNGLLLIPTMIDYTTARFMEDALPKRRKMLLLVSLVTNLAVLGFFKYYNFFASNLIAAFNLSNSLLVANLVLPVGISFYTFNALSYVIDVYRGQLKPARNINDFALFIMFFPHLVAGPIVRAADFLPQIIAWKRPSSAMVLSGVDLILIGLVKKMVFADQFALVAENYFRDVNAFSGFLPAWSGVLAFSMQIFFDFSGYTDIARGCARLLGFEFKLNFARPYLSTNITEFWRRWHISLSTWLRDYLYIPLGGNRKGSMATYQNLMITMLLGGLWHGASWNFVAWGGLHGGALAIHKRIGWPKSLRTQFKHSEQLGAVLGWLCTFLFVCITWVFFRAQTLEISWHIIKSMFGACGIGKPLLHAGHLAMISISIVLARLEENRKYLEKFHLVEGWPRGMAYAVFCLFLELFSNTAGKIPFVYFQF